MNVSKLFKTIDTHTGGNPTRTLINGLPHLEGNTMGEKMLYMKENYDWIRQFLMNEPRGHSVMSGVLLTEPCDKEADFGVIYIETGGYLPMCGHDTIGVCTALVESGMVEANEPVMCLTLDTPAGIVKTKLEIENKKVKSVAFENVPSFLLKEVTVTVEGLGDVDVQIAYGGNFYGIVEAKDYNIELVESNATTIINHAINIRNKVNEQFDVIHPTYDFIQGLTHIEFSAEPTNPLADIKNTVVVPPGGIDRSPCGTGTSAKAAVLYKENKLNKDELFIHESIVGTLFEAKVIEETMEGNIQAVKTTIKGSAWLMGLHTFYYDESDDLNEGFLLIPPMK